MFKTKNKNYLNKFFVKKKKKIHDIEYQHFNFFCLI